MVCCKTDHLPSSPLPLPPPPAPQPEKEMEESSGQTPMMDELLMDGGREGFKGIVSRDSDIYCILPLATYSTGATVIIVSLRNAIQNIFGRHPRTGVKVAVSRDFFYDFLFHDQPHLEP